MQRRSTARVAELEAKCSALEAELMRIRAENAAAAADPRSPSKPKEARRSAPPSPSSHGAAAAVFLDPDDAGVFAMAWSRSKWLTLFLASLSVTAVIMGNYEHVLQKNVALAYFVPLLIGHGGNAGGQVVGTILAAGKLKAKDAMRVLWKEAAVAVCVGSAMAAVAAPVLSGADFVLPPVATTVMITLTVLTVASAAIASTVAFTAAALGLDAATVAPPATTTLIDACGLLLYFHIASLTFAYYGEEL